MKLEAFSPRRYEADRRRQGKQGKQGKQGEKEQATEALLGSLTGRNLLNLPFGGLNENL